MAGRPVTVQSASSGLLWGLITFAVLSVIFLGLFIFQLTKVKAAENARDQAQQRNMHFGSPPPYYDDEARSRRARVADVMADDIRGIALLTTGNAEDVGASIERKITDLLSTVNRQNPATINTGDAVLTVVTKLGEALKTARERYDTLQIVFDDLTAERDSLTQQLRTKEEEFKEEVDRLSAQLQRTQAEKNDALARKDEQLQELQSRLTATEQQLRKVEREGLAVVRDKDIEIGQLKTQIDSLQKKIREILPERFDPAEFVTKADGRILRAIPGSEVVYIDLGSVDRIRPAMTFEVYSPVRDMTQGLRGKASIEVVTIMERTAECRITRQAPGRPIVEGDVVVNIAFERNRKPKFVVRGDFDLDYDGMIDFTGMDQMIAIIREWGGEVVEELDESVDVVVIGLPPNVPDVSADSKISDIFRDQVLQSMFNASRFAQLKQRAQALNIPVITQNMFLFFTGYAHDTTVLR